MRVLLFFHRVKCIRFVTFAAVTFTGRSERLVACKTTLMKIIPIITKRVISGSL